MYSKEKTDIGKTIGNLNSSKVGTFKNIPKKCLKVTFDISIPFIQPSGMKSLF